MARTRIEGHDVMLFDENGHSFAFGTNSTLSIEAAMNDVSDKDTSIYGTQEPGKITWSITSDHTLDMNEYLNFVEWQQAQTKKKVWYGLRSGYKGSGSFDPTSEVNDGTTDSYRSIDATSYALCGYVFCQSINQTASNGDKANYSVTLAGAGALTKAKFA